MTRERRCRSCACSAGVRSLVVCSSSLVQIEVTGASRARPDSVSAVRDVGIIAAQALLDQASLPAAIEIAGDELTGEEIASIHGGRAGLPARYEALPLGVMDGQDDLQAMFRWFAETPAYQADLDQVRQVHPGLRTLGTRLDAGHAPAAP